MKYWADIKSTSCVQKLSQQNLLKKAKLIYRFVSACACVSYNQLESKKEHTQKIVKKLKYTCRTLKVFTTKELIHINKYVHRNIKL